MHKSSLDAVYAANDCFELESQMTLAMCEEINTPHSLAIFLAIRNHEWVELKRLSPDPRGYVDGILQVYDRNMRSIWPSIEEFACDYQVSKMLTKSDSVPTGIATDAVAIKLFKEIEGVISTKSAPRGEAWLLTFQREVDRLLHGESEQSFLNPTRLEEILSLGRLGPGVSAGLSAPVKSEKLRSPTSFSPALRAFVDSVKGERWCKAQPASVPVKAVKVMCVPKTSYTDRTISSVPVVDMILQLGLGAVLGKRLKIDGIDVRDQGKNQGLAMVADKLNLATVDLSSASSWFCESNLVGILPEDLVHFLSLIRPRYYEDKWDENGEEVPRPIVKPFHNWLPMGCGYTFNLMTLYFWALVRSIVPKSSLELCGVYGDDIILPREHCAELIRRLEFLGFKVNHAKTFSDGRFFESCGHDYFCGTKVTPFYLRRGKVGSAQLKQQTLSYRVQLANKLRLWSRDHSGCKARWMPLWRVLHKRIHTKAKPYVPAMFGDSGLITSLEEAIAFSKVVPDVSAKDAGWEGVYYKVRHLIPTPKYRSVEDEFTLLLNLWKQDGAAPAYIEAMHFKCTPMYSRSVLLKLLDPDPPVFTCGAEPVLGLFGKPRNTWSSIIWPDERLNWE